MILYLDASALVKLYINEPGTDDVFDWIRAAEMAVTGLISRAEVVAAIGRATRMGVVNGDEARQSVEKFEADWESFKRVPISETTVARAARFAWVHNLRGYDAVHLASAVQWSEALNMAICMASFDQQLCHAAREIGMEVFPEKV